MRYVIATTVTQRAEPDHRASVAARRSHQCQLRLAHAGSAGHFSSPRAGLPESFFGRAGHAVRAAAVGPEAAAVSLVR